MKFEWSYHLDGVVKFKPYSFYEKVYDTCAMFYNEKVKTLYCVLIPVRTAVKILILTTTKSFIQKR